MPKVSKGGLEKTVVVTMKIVRNGVSVTGRREDTQQDMEYVYSGLDKALKEVPSIVSVLSDEETKMTEDKLNEEENKINKGGGNY